MSASLIFQILCINLVLNEVSSECDRMEGPPGLTDCVHSPLYSKYQAAVCLPKTTIHFETKHVTCLGESTEFCWFLCTTAPSHGGLSACQCNPDSNTKKFSTLDNECYLPWLTLSCSWFSKCLKSKYSCTSITTAERDCVKLQTIAMKHSNIGISTIDFTKEWLLKVIFCIQADLVHLLYPQILSDCEKITRVINWSTYTCFNEPHLKACDLSMSERVFTFPEFIGLDECKGNKIIPYWAKLLVFYVENYTENDKNTLAVEVGEALSKNFNWEKSGLFYKSVAPEIANKKTKTITIRIHLFSKTKDSNKANDAIDDLKKYIEEGKMAELVLEDNARVDVTHVGSCMTTECFSKYFSYQTRTIACTRLGGYCLDSSQHALPCKETKDGLCHKQKCCFPPNLARKYPCTEKGGWCQEKTLSCDQYEKRNCEGTKYCCLSHKECTNVKIIKRKDWKATKPKNIAYLKDWNTPVGLFFIHHTVTPRCKTFASCASIIRNIQNDHMTSKNKTWDDIGYSFLAGDDGNIYEGQGWSRHGVHTGKYNHKALAVSFIGNFTDELPSIEARNAVKNLIQCGVDNGYIRTDYKLLGHRAAKPSTECPGDMLYNEIKDWKNFYETL